MSIEQTERDSHRATIQEEILFIESHMRKVRQLERDPEAFVRDQAAGIVDHLGKFIEGLEPKFNRYFAVGADEHHKRMHYAFWAELLDKYPLVTEIEQDPTTTVRQFILDDTGTGLIARTDYDDETGKVFGIAYEAFSQPDHSPVMLGRISMLLAMQ